MKDNIYFRELRWKNFTLMLVLVITTVILPDIYYSIANKFLIEPLRINTINSTIRFDIFFAFCFFLNIVYWANNFYHGLYPCINSSIYILIFVVWYFILYRATSNVILTPFIHIPSFFYSDILLFSFLSFITKFKYYSKKDKSITAYGFLEDRFKIGESIDKLGREEFAKRICSHLLLTKNPTSAFVIAIISPWGYGKSGFLNMMERFLSGAGDISRNSAQKFSNGVEINFSREHFEQVIIINYNPWKNFDNKKLIEDFLANYQTGLSVTTTMLQGT